jgi:homoserine kinase
MSADLSPTAKSVINVLCYVAVSLVVQNVIVKRNIKEPSDTNTKKSAIPGTPIKPEPVTMGSDQSKYSRPYQHEKKMTERLFAGSSSEEEDGLERTRVVVRVPATSANLGPGFDAIGMALDMWSEFTIERSDKFEVICEGEGAHDMPLDDTNLVCFGLKAAFKKAGKEVPILKYHLVNRIPYARGLGSSSAAIVGGLVAGCVLAGHRFPAWGSEDLLNMAAEIEGHPDNVAPALYGGIQLGIHTGERWMTERVNLPPGLLCVCFIPDAIGKTSTARGVLSDTITRKEAIFNIGRVAWLINALASNNIDQLRYGVEDALHQPQRGAAVYPHLYPIIQAAEAAGASAAYLSGAGPTVMAITSGASGDIFTQREKERVDSKVAEAMLAAAEKCGTIGQVFITAPVEQGAYVVSAEPPFSYGLVKYRGGV